MEIGDYAYILIGIIAMIVSIINQNAKKRKATAARQKRATAIPDEDVYMPDERVDTLIETIMDEAKETGYDKVVPSMIDPAMEGESLIEDKKSAAINSRIDKAPTTDSNAEPRHTMAFDIKSAIIFSEILNRPYK